MDFKTLNTMKRLFAHRNTVRIFAATWIIMAAACMRRPLEDDEPRQVAKIQVNIDWSKSGISPGSTYGSEGVHRVSLRFFPKDGYRKPFDVFMEGNVTQKTIEVEVGSYSVIVFNESIEDDSYWGEAVTFSDADSYGSFAANAAVLTDEQRRQRFPFYKADDGEKFITEPLRLASWSLDNFKITETMALVTQGQQPEAYLSEEEKEMLGALKKVVMRALTRQVTLTARIENLTSLGYGFTAIQGLAHKVYMASGQTVATPATHLFMLGGRKYDSGAPDGTTTNTFFIFGRAASAENIIAEDVILANGDFHKPEPPLRFNVTDQMANAGNAPSDIRLNIAFKLPQVDGNINVDEWEEGVYTIQ